MKNRDVEKQSQFICNSCNIIANSEEQWTSHLAGLRHNQIIDQQFDYILSGSNKTQ